MSIGATVEAGDLHDDAFSRDPFAVWERLRHDAPLFHDTVDDVYLLTHVDEALLRLVRVERSRTRRAIIAVQFGHQDGGQLVRKLYGHPDAARARGRIRGAFRQAPPVPVPLVAALL